MLDSSQSERESADDEGTQDADLAMKTPEAKQRIRRKRSKRKGEHGGQENKHKFDFKEKRFPRISIDRSILSQKHIDWVEPIFIMQEYVPEENTDFICDGPTPKKRRNHKDPCVVDKILGMTVDAAGDDLYFIRWYGYDDRTWEPFTNLDNCPGKLVEFRRELKQLDKYKSERVNFERNIQLFRDKINKPWPNGKSGIVVTNDVDITCPMMTFHYIRELKMPENVEFVPVSCECEDGICDKKCSCATTENLKFPYNEDGTVNRPQNFPIYECNAGCSCACNTENPCPYRVVQRGRQVKFEIFKTANGRGWGVKALEPIKKNQFVVEYVGEVITSEEADNRGTQYDARGRTYLFDMDFFETEDCPIRFTIDAKPYGNEARFINHACSPNLFSRAVFWETMDQSLHHLALFARRDIKVGEELSFNYNNSSLSKDFKYNANKNDGQVKCQCKKNCPNKLFK